MDVWLEPSVSENYCKTVTRLSWGHRSARVARPPAGCCERGSHGRSRAAHTSWAGLWPRLGATIPRPSSCNQEALPTTEATSLSHICLAGAQ